MSNWSTATAEFHQRPLRICLFMYANEWVVEPLQNVVPAVATTADDRSGSGPELR